MKKENYTIAKVALGIYLFCIGSVLLMNYWAEQTSKHNELLEIQKSVNELRYYVNEDVFNGNLKENLYEVYTKELYNIEKSIKELSNE